VRLRLNVSAMRGRASALTVLGLAGLIVAALCALGRPEVARAQGSVPEASSTIDTTLDAGEADAQEHKRKFVKWNEYDGPISTLRVGWGFAYDFSSYAQDDKSKQQFSLEPENKLRDFRILLKGRFKTERPASWTLGYMYDGADKSWHFRQTGISVAAPELSGRIFIGRTKEGYSQTKVMVGYYIWGIERSQTLDAFVPILADGIKWMGRWERQRLVLDVGLFADGISESEKFAIYDNQFVTRLVWQPILSDAEHRVLHVGVMNRECQADDGVLQVKSKPGDFLAPNFLDTGKFPAGHVRGTGLEAVYRSGPWLFSTEYDWQRVEAASGETPMFRGGDAAVAWLITGETRPYNATGAFFDAVSPRKSVFEGGRGAVEAIVNLTYNDFDDGISFQGGKFWRVTPMAIWHMADFLHVSFAYGYGVLDRFGVKGATQFFQTRLLTYY
jgi:phosphate-selective porin OprO and OprP